MSYHGRVVDEEHNRRGDEQRVRGTLRLLDICLVVLLAAPALLLTLLFGLLVVINSPGPMLYRQVRVGKDGRLFTLVKLRSMHLDAEVAGPALAARADPRVTTVGRLIRRTRIDELPQLWNVLRGDMSLVGPRPERPEFTSTYLSDIPDYGFRFSVRPGVTGLAQINGGYDLSIEQKLYYDLSFISRLSISLYFAILLKTVIVVITGQGAR